MLMVVAFFQFGVGAWAFYAWQPYFLDLLGRPDAVWVAGAVAAGIALAGIAGNALVGVARRVASRRTTILLAGSTAYAAALAGVGLVGSFGPAVAIFLAGIVISRMASPVRQAYLHEMISSEHRATVASFDALFGSLGSVGGQTGLGYLAQVQTIPVGFVAAGGIASLALPVLLGLRKLGGPADRIARERPETPVEPAEASAEAPT
jgi:hypothetical protein